MKSNPCEYLKQIFPQIPTSLLLPGFISLPPIPFLTFCVRVPIDFEPFLSFIYFNSLNYANLSFLNALLWDVGYSKFSISGRALVCSTGSLECFMIHPFTLEFCRLQRVCSGLGGLLLTLVFDEACGFLFQGCCG